MNRFCSPLDIIRDKSWLDLIHFLQQKKQTLSLPLIKILPTRFSGFNKKIIFYFYTRVIHFLLHPATTLLWNFFPEFSWTTKSAQHNWTLLYDIVDYHTFQKTNQQHLIQNSDFVFCISPALQKKLKSENTKEIHLIPAGIDDLFFQPQKTDSLTISLPSSPIAVYTGEINNRIQLSLLQKVARRLRQVSFVFVGPIANDPNIPNQISLDEWSSFFSEPNIYHYTKQSRKTIKTILHSCQVALLPYKPVYEFNYYSYPMKLLEYLAIGIPVVSSPLPASKCFTSVSIAKSAQDWEKMILTNINTKTKHSNTDYKKIQKQSWSHKIQAILNTLSI